MNQTRPESRPAIDDSTAALHRAASTYRELIGSPGDHAEVRYFEDVAALQLARLELHVAVERWAMARTDFFEA